MRRPRGQAAPGAVADGGFGLGLDGPLLGRRLSAAAGPAGSGRGRGGSGGETLALARERELEGGRLPPVAERPRSDGDRGGGLGLRPGAGEQAGGLPLLGGAFTLAPPLVGELSSSAPASRARAGA